MSALSDKILKEYQVRKNKRQKNAFLEFAKEFSASRGYTARIEKGYFGAKNLVVGDLARAKAVYTAHYDTCARLPFPNFITPKSFGIYLLYQIALVVGICIPSLLVSVAISTVLAMLGCPYEIIFLASELPLIAVLLLLTVGPANPHTANDNSSGVILLLEVMDALPQKDREQVAFVFFDMEELGLLGSAGFASKHKKEMAGKLLLNFDCVSDGDHFLFALRKKAKTYSDLLERSFSGNDAKSVEILSKGVFYPSDQMNFPCGVGVAALKCYRGKILYMDRIHTKRDTVYQEENILFLKEGCLKLAQLLGMQSGSDL